MIVIKPRHVALAATLPTLFLVHAISGQRAEHPCQSDRYDTPPSILAPGSSQNMAVLISLDDEILEVGSGVQVHESFSPKPWQQPQAAAPEHATDFHWRWEQSPSRLEPWEHTVRPIATGGALHINHFHQDAQVAGAKQIPAIERRAKDGEVLWSFVPRETARRAARLPSSDIAADLIIDGDRAYVAYFSTASASGAEVFAIDLMTGLPIWRELVREFSPRTGAHHPKLQMRLANGKLDLNFSGSGGDVVYRLDARRGGVEGREDVSDLRWHMLARRAEHTGPELRRIVMADGHHLALTRPHRSYDGVQITSRNSAQNTRWRLNMAGDVLRVFNDQDTPEVLQLLTYDERGDGGAIVSAVDIERGDILWANRLEGVGVLPDATLRKKELQTSTTHYIDGDGDEQEILIVHGFEIWEHGAEARSYSFSQGIDPLTGQTIFLHEMHP